jgi:TonB family protein
MVAEPTGDIATLCAGEAAMRLAANAAAGSPERFQHLREAAAHYSRAADLLKNLELKIYAYEAVVRVHDASNLNEPAVVEPALRQLATLVAGTPAPLLRLARFQEGHEAADAAEHTLLGARQQYPDNVALLREMSAFFARRVVVRLPKSDQEGTASPDVQPAKTAELPYRPACQEFSFGNPTSAVTGARLSRPIPMLDDAALEAVKQWRFQPTIIDGRAVPPRLTVTVNFTLQKK